MIDALDDAELAQAGGGTGAVRPEGSHEPREEAVIETTVRSACDPTSASVALIDASGERTFLHTTGANATLTAGETREEPFTGRALHIAGALVLDELDGEPTASLLSEARWRGIMTSVDTVFDARGRWDRKWPRPASIDFAPRK